MSEVVIRCPNCGTTQGALGECEACHEADARYFCTNHAPGRWLDGPACSECGARYGIDRVRTRPAPPAPPRPRAETPSPLGRRPVPRGEPDRPVDVAWGGPVRTTPPADLGEIGSSTPRVEWPPAAPPPFPPFGVRVVPMAGCVRRVVVLFIVLLVLAALAFFGLLGVGTRLIFGAEDGPRARPEAAEVVHTRVT